MSNCGEVRAHGVFLIRCTRRLILWAELWLLLSFVPQYESLCAAHDGYLPVVLTLILFTQVAVAMMVVADADLCCRLHLWVLLPI